MLLFAPLALAQEAPASPASFVVYRPWPDARDALATALAPPPFDASRLPATRIDRDAFASSAPENRPENAAAHYREMLRLVQAAEAEGSPVTLVVDGDVAPGELRVEVNVSLRPTWSFRNASLALVVFEHGVVVAGRAHPYVARFALAPEPIRGSGVVAFSTVLDPAWDVDALGVVAIAKHDEEVVQSATWLPRQLGPTIQAAKAPLVELVTASWCTPCVPAEEGFLLLATQRGAAGPLEAPGGASYLRPPSALLWLGLAAGAAAAVVLLGRREP